MNADHEIRWLARQYLNRNEADIKRQCERFAESLRDFLHDLLNYPLEGDWRQSVQRFDRLWIGRGLVITAASLERLQGAIERQLLQVGEIQTAEGMAPAEPAPMIQSVAVQNPAAEAGTKTPDTDEAKTAAENAFKEQETSLQREARQFAAQEQARLGLDLSEKSRLEQYLFANISRELLGVEPIPPPQFWLEKEAQLQKRLAARRREPSMRGLTPEEAEQSTRAWQHDNYDRLSKQDRAELDEYDRKALWEQRYGGPARTLWQSFLDFLNPVYDGTGTLNDWLAIFGGFAGAARPPGGRGRIRRPLAMPTGPRRPTPRGPRNTPAQPTPLPSASRVPPKLAKGLLPPPVAEVRARPQRGKGVPHPSHVKGATAEEAAALEIHSLPNEVVIRWGQPIGAPGADVISYNLETRVVTLWDVKFRSAPRRIRPSTTFGAHSISLARSIEYAIAAIKGSQLSAEDKQAATRSIKNQTFNTRTLGSGQARNSTFGDHQ